jgi:hypothetical protein
MLSKNRPSCVLLDIDIKLRTLCSDHIKSIRNTLSLEAFEASWYYLGGTEIEPDWSLVQLRSIKESLLPSIHA